MANGNQDLIKLIKFNFQIKNKSQFTYRLFDLTLYELQLYMLVGALNDKYCSS